RSRTFTGRREVPSPSSAAVSPAVNFREPGKSEAGVFMDSIKRVAQNSLYHLFRIKKSFGDLPRGAAVAFVVAVDLLESVRDFARRSDTPAALFQITLFLGIFFRSQKKREFQRLARALRQIGKFQKRHALGVFVSFLCAHDPIVRIPVGNRGEYFSARLEA